MYRRYYSYTYPIGGQVCNGNFYYFYGNGSAISETGEEMDDVDFDYDYNEDTGKMVMSMDMPGCDKSTLLTNGTDEVEPPEIEEPEIVEEEKIVEVPVPIPEPVLNTSYSYSYSRGYSKVIYGYMYSRYYSYS